MLCRSFTQKRHRQLRVKDLNTVPMWWLEWDSNPRPFRRKATNLPMSHHTSQWRMMVNISGWWSKSTSMRTRRKLTQFPSWNYSIAWKGKLEFLIWQCVTCTRTISPLTLQCVTCSRTISPLTLQCVTCTRTISPLTLQCITCTRAINPLTLQWWAAFVSHSLVVHTCCFLACSTKFIIINEIITHDLYNYDYDGWAWLLLLFYHSLTNVTHQNYSVAIVSNPYWQKCVTYARPFWI